MYYHPKIKNPYARSDTGIHQPKTDTKHNRRARNNLAALVIGLLIGGALVFISS